MTTLIYRIRPDGSDLTLATPALKSLSTVSQPDVSGDGTRLVFRRNDGTVALRDLSSGVDTVLDPGDTPAFSPDGRRIAYLRSGNIIMRDGDGTNPRTVPYFGFVYRRVAWTSDSNFLIIYDGPAVLIDVRTGVAFRTRALDAFTNLSFR